MGKIYQNQTKLVLNFELGEDISTATVEVLYKDPDGIEAVLGQAVIIDAPLGKVRLTSGTAAFFTKVGFYKLWTKVTFPDTKVLWGEASKIQIFKEGS
ncbi:MAG: hypothetical protein ACRDBG_03425 [Waterburya sp.]